MNDEVKEVKITLADLSVNDVNLLVAGLGKLPLDAAIDVFMRIKTQAEAQLQKQDSVTQ